MWTILKNSIWFLTPFLLKIWWPYEIEQKILITESEPPSVREGGIRNRTIRKVMAKLNPIIGEYFLLFQNNLRRSIWIPKGSNWVESNLGLNTPYPFPQFCKSVYNHNWNLWINLLDYFTNKETLKTTIGHFCWTNMQILHTVPRFMSPQKLNQL